MKNISIIRKDVKNISLKVKPNRDVEVIVPDAASDEYISNFLYRKEKWIEEQLRWFEENSPKEENRKEYISGETFRYLGKNYRLKVKEDSDEDIKLYRGYFHLKVKNKEDRIRKEQLVEDWYREKANIKFKELVDKYQKLVKKEYNSINIRKMKTNWGSCSSKGNITLNFELIKKPKYCIEYVVLHELIHLIHPNHSEEFYQELTVHMPDWKWRKDRLEEIN